MSAILLYDAPKANLLRSGLRMFEEVFCQSVVKQSPSLLARGRAVCVDSTITLRDLHRYLKNLDIRIHFRKCRCCVFVCWVGHELIHVRLKLIPQLFKLFCYVRNDINVCSDFRTAQGSISHRCSQLQPWCPRRIALSLLSSKDSHDNYTADNYTS